MAGSSPSGGRRVLALVLAGLLVVGVGVGVAIFVAAGGGGGKDVVTVSGLSGSEKLPFFQDERVVSRLRDLGFDVQVEAAGSREIATKFDLTKYDFALPAGVPAAQQIKNKVKTKAPYSVFYTPMVVASFKPIADILVKNGLATRVNGTYTLDTKRYLESVDKEVHWDQLAGAGAYPVDRSLIVTSTNPSASCLSQNAWRPSTTV